MVIFKGFENDVKQLTWNDRYMYDDKEKFELVCGLSESEPIVLDIAKYPNILITGLSGYGKSVLETCLAWQSIKKGARLYMADLKGGFEFTPYMEFGKVITDRKKVLEILRHLANETMLRMELFNQEKLNNFEDYNRKYPENELSRVIFFCDELSEMLSIAAKEEKKEIEEIVKHLRLISTFGRGQGINLILATDRPKVVSDKLQKNMVVKISTKEKLENMKGYFVYTIGQETKDFQAFNFSSSYLKSGQYQKGRMLATAV